MIGLIENTGGDESKSPPMAKGYLFALVDSIFKEGGYLQSEMQLDHRPEQAAMAARHSAANQRTALLASQSVGFNEIEAGTTGHAPAVRAAYS